MELEERGKLSDHALRKKGKGYIFGTECGAKAGEISLHIVIPLKAHDPYMTCPRKRKRPRSPVYPTQINRVPTFLVHENFEQ